MADTRPGASGAQWTESIDELKEELDRALARAVNGAEHGDFATGSTTRSLPFELDLVPCVARARFMAKKSGRLSCSVEVGVVGAGLSDQADGFDLQMNLVFFMSWEDMLGAKAALAANCFSVVFADACARLAQTEHFMAERERRSAFEEAREMALELEILPASERAGRL